MSDRDYRSRKFLVTVSTIVLTSVLAYFGKMGQDVAMVFAAGIASYNWANLRQAQNGHAPK